MGIAEQGNADLANASKTKGWVIGSFMEGFAKTSGAEVKLWHYDSQPDYPVKAYDGVEFIVVEGGVLDLWIDGAGEVSLNGSRREYIILEPGTPKQVFVRNGPVWGVTVRWPHP